MVRGDESDERMRKLEEQVIELQKELHALKEAQQKKAEEAQARQAESAKSLPAVQESSEKAQNLLDRVTLTGYGSIRFEHNTLDNLQDTFTYRRFTFDVDAEIAPRLRYFMELEFPRFRKLEFDNSLSLTAAGGLAARQSITGTDHSTITLEQAWMQYDLLKWLSLRGGALFVPLGRFNLHPGDKNWLLPRRPLVDRGVPVLPSTSAWDELGVGFIGKTAVGERGRLDYQFYVLNGVALNTQIQTALQTQANNKDKLATTVSLKPDTGTFATDSKSDKALTGRLAFIPAVGHELAGSFYWGRYTPQFMTDEKVWSVGLDGLTTLGPLELEGEYVFSRFEGLRNVAQSFAQIAKNRSAVGTTTGVDTSLQFQLANLAGTKHGYWLEARYPFWPEALNHTVLAQGLSNPRLIPILRWEQVWLPSLLKEANFADGALTEFATESRFIHRVTAGLAYRPVPLVSFTLAYEFTWTNDGKSLATVTNFLPAKAKEDRAHALLFGMVFGFSS